MGRIGSKAYFSIYCKINIVYTNMPGNKKNQQQTNKNIARCWRGQRQIIRREGKTYNPQRRTSRFSSPKMESKSQQNDDFKYYKGKYYQIKIKC